MAKKKIYKFKGWIRKGDLGCLENGLSEWHFEKEEDRSYAGYLYRRDSFYAEIYDRTCNKTDEPVEITVRLLTRRQL